MKCLNLIPPSFSTRVAVRVDDFFLSRNSKFYREVLTVLKNVFVLDESERQDFTFGSQIKQTKNGEIIVHQNDFLRGIEELDNLPQKKYMKQEEIEKQLQSKYKGALGDMYWLATNGRPDISFDVMALSLVRSISMTIKVLSGSRQR